MACNIPGDSTSVRNTMAPLDTAYNNSNLMRDFQNKLSGNNTIPINNNANINDNISNLVRNNQILPHQSEEKIDVNVDKIVGEYYNRDDDIKRQLNRDTIGNEYLYPGISTVQNGINFPLDRSQYYSPQVYGSELLEGYTNTGSGIDIWRLLLLIILIAALIYGIYWLYNNNRSNLP
ncbi:hypothetical protein H012_gp730 [Acanthamoeba polyphaga moumouvirus]|uniref:Uncharacterized protein n=2 Tax=Moumouvirus TaxID=3080801 RepID=L7RFT5_9VIRU|nr:hypothetical protein H012_gp730 [Acanthamoeba polyphaga moumouvirus]AEX63094.1 hypothetical protein mv_L892 [Moumouvirus Monve]AGC01735.1 hypothetical protein Moumou_00191 [Acanthamoeba polyphaga moumouvirus]AQN68080.1 hypothetical protein [Saudi moumouvirus]